MGIVTNEIREVMGAISCKASECLHVAGAIYVIGVTI